MLRAAHHAVRGPSLSSDDRCPQGKRWPLPAPAAIGTAIIISWRVISPVIARAGNPPASTPAAARPATPAANTRYFLDHGIALERLLQACRRRNCHRLGAVCYQRHRREQCRRGGNCKTESTHRFPPWDVLFGIKKAAPQSYSFFNRHVSPLYLVNRTLPEFAPDSPFIPCSSGF